VGWIRKSNAGTITVLPSKQGRLTSNAPQENRASYANTFVLAQSLDTKAIGVVNTSNQTAANGNVLRILVPINAKHDSHWGIRYALRRQREGKQVEVILLNVDKWIVQVEEVGLAHSVGADQVLSERTQALFEKVTTLLAAENIPCHYLFKQGDVVFSILDAAEEMTCDEIAMPEPKKGLTSFFSRDIVYDAMLQQRDIPIVAVNSDGMASRPREVKGVPKPA